MPTKEYNRLAQARWRKENSVYDKNKRRSNRISIKDALQQIKLDKGCSICGYKKSERALHFHHIVKSDVRLSYLLHYSLKRCLEEIRKCIVLCANCHAETHESEDFGNNI